MTDARVPNVIPFPGCEGRTRGGFEQIRHHAEALDRELQALARGTFWSPGEWARRTAIPIVRTECIRGYVTAADAIPPRAVGQYRRRRLARSRNELLAVLSATRSSLTRMGEPSLGLAGRQDTLEELFAHRDRQRHLLAKLEKDWPTRTAARVS